jgi:FlaA1/EpsC-like NDP-sugar epimerase
MLNQNYIQYEKKLISDKNRFKLNIKDKRELQKDLKNSNILITGAAGSIGSVFTKDILNYNFKKLVLLDKNENELTEINRKIILLIKNKKILNKISYICSDLTSFNINDLILKFKITHYLNFAALKHVRSEEGIDSIKYMLLTNSSKFIDSSHLKLLRSLKKIFSISTDKSVNPSSILGLSKVLMEQKLAKIKKKNKFFVSTARFANVGFSNGSILKNIIDRINENKTFGIPEDIKRYFITHEEASSICFASLLKRNDGYILIPDNKILGHQQTIKSLCDKICKMKKIKPSYHSKTNKILRTINKKKYPIYLSSGINHGQKKQEEMIGQTEKIVNDLTCPYFKKTKLYFYKDFTNTLNFILKQNSVQNVKNILRKKFKVYKPVFKPQKISKTI